MGNKLKKYSSNEVKTTVGVYPVDSGRNADGAFVQISQPEERYGYKRSPDGEGVRYDNGPGAFRVKIIVMKTSAANAYFSALHNGDIATEGGAGIVPLNVTDLGGKDLFFAAEAWIVKFPDLEHAKEAGTVEWEFDCHNGKQFLGGH